MIFHDSKIILLHPGKTGGTSLEHTLRDKYMPDIKLNKARIERQDIMFGLSQKYNIYLQHADLRFYIDELGYKLNDFTTITTVRRPYERLLSCYFYNGKDSVATFREFVFNHLERLISINSKSKYSVSHFCPQHYYVNYKDYRVNYLIKLENFSKDCKSIGIDVKYHYSQTINVKKYSNYMEAYDKEMKDYVYNLYEEDFITLGYQR